MKWRGRRTGKALVGTLVLVALGAQGSSDTERSTENAPARKRGTTSLGSGIERRFLVGKPDVGNSKAAAVAANDMSKSGREGKIEDIQAEREEHDAERGSETLVLDPDSTREKHLEQGFERRRLASRECPYAVHSEEEAMARIRNKSIPGNVVVVEHLRFCRTGNRFSSAYRNLALGYCCKSKMVWLPPKDDILAPGIFNEGTPGPRWFDFSSAPDVGGFDSGTCKTHITWAGPRAFHMHQLRDKTNEHYNPPLLDCIRRVPRLLACEAVYYFPKDVDVCSSTERAGNGYSMEQTEKKNKGCPGSVLGESEWGDDGRENEQDDECKGEGGAREKPAGNLALHVRSGDIFGDSVLSYYGQPPLQYYLFVIQHQKWDRVDVTTFGLDAKTLNPVVTALKIKQAKGELPSNVCIHTTRSMADDLRTMICADALGLAKSTLSHLISFHSTASRIYGPTECNNQLIQVAKFRPEVKVYGLSWPKNYTVYENWKNTVDQRAEMLSYDKIEGLLRCKGQ